MTFTYDVEDEDGEVLKTYTVDVVFDEDVPGFFSGRPEKCRPDSGGEILDLTVYLENKDVTHQIDDDLYFRIKDAVREKLR